MTDWLEFMEADARAEARADREWHRRKDRGDFDDQQPEEEEEDETDI